MKKLLTLSYIALFTGCIFAQTAKTIQLNSPDLNRGLSVMKALSVRASATEFDTTNLSLQDLSDLLWAANGINRPENGKRTAPSAMNSQDIDLYLFLQKGVYFYQPTTHSLDLIVEQDARDLVAGKQAKFAKAPAICLLVSDLSRFKTGTDSLKMVWAAEDAGIVSQNIALYCASVGLTTRPRATMERQKLKELLKLKDAQQMMLNNPVGFGK